MRTIEDMVRMEVHYCCSALVATLAGGADIGQNMGDLGALVDQAFELAAPIDDWESPLIENGWTHDDKGWHHQEDIGEEGERDAYRACEEADLDPYQVEVYEHWIVSDWLADKLAEHGEKVDKDFAGLTVWARTTTGQAISADYVIEQVYAATHRAEPLLGDDLEASDWRPSL